MTRIYVPTFHPTVIRISSQAFGRTEVDADQLIGEEVAGLFYSDSDGSLVIIDPDVSANNYRGLLVNHPDVIVTDESIKIAITSFDWNGGIGSFEIDDDPVWPVEIDDELVIDANAETIVWVPGAKAFLRRRLDRTKVDFVLSGDSNAIFGGNGHDHGLQHGVLPHYPMHSTPLLSQNENNGSGSGQGYMCNRASNGTAVGATTGAPTELDKYLNIGDGGLFPARYTYVSPEGSVGSNTLIGLVLQANCPVDNGANLKGDIHWGSFDGDDDGSFRPFARLGEAPFTTIVDGGSISTNLGVVQMNRTTVNMAADPSRTSKPLEFKPLRTGVQGIAGSYFNTYMRVRNVSRNNGFALGTQEYRGGQPLSTQLNDFLEASDETLWHYFNILREDQGDGPKTIGIVVTGGINDANAGRTKSQFKSDFVAIQERIRSIWEIDPSWDFREVVWIMFVTQAQSDPDIPLLIEYRDGIEEIEQSTFDLIHINIPEIAPYSEFVANGWFNTISGDPDTPHMSITGYEQVGIRIANELFRIGD